MQDQDSVGRQVPDSVDEAVHGQITHHGQLIIDLSTPDLKTNKGKLLPLTPNCYG